MDVQFFGFDGTQTMQFKPILLTQSDVAKNYEFLVEEFGFCSCGILILTGGGNDAFVFKFQKHHSQR